VTKINHEPADAFTDDQAVDKAAMDPDLEPPTIAALQRELTEFRTERRALLRELEVARNETTTIEFNYRAASSELAMVKERLLAIENSRTWRLARAILNPLEKAFSRWPILKNFLLTDSPAPFSKDVNPHTRRDVEHWLKQYDHLSADDLAYIRQHLQQMENKPLISIILPIYNTPESLLRASLVSVLQHL
jgi:hypothetical protein